jgi:transcription factor TGA
MLANELNVSMNHCLSKLWLYPNDITYFLLMLQTLVPQLDPLTEQQMVGICGLEQSLQQAEEALTQGLEQLHQSLAITVAGSGCLADDANIGSFMGDMAVALGKLSNLEGFVIQVT